MAMAEQAIPEIQFMQETALQQLRQHVGEFLELEDAGIREEELYHRVLSTVHHLCAAILQCEDAALSREEIVQILEPVRRIHARSPFVSRLQSWPRGYQGDFVTVERLWRGDNRAPKGTLEHLCEAYSLSRAIAQQHRNKVQHQAARILRTMLANPRQSTILSMACGGCPDLRTIADHLPMLAGRIVINDMDRGALRFAKKMLGEQAQYVEAIHGNAADVVLQMAPDSCDLVLAGGLFDYLPSKVAVRLMRRAWRTLKQGGVLFFTNIAAGNPYRALIEYFGDWTLIERTEEDVFRFCDDAGIPRSNVKITREETGLALLVEITKLQ